MRHNQQGGHVLTDHIAVAGLSVDELTPVNKLPLLLAHRYLGATSPSAWMPWQRHEKEKDVWLGKATICFAMLLCTFALNSVAQVSVFPTAPTDLDMVRVRVPTGSLGLDVIGAPDTYDPKGTTLVMSGNKIVVSLQMVGGNGFPGGPSLDWPLGKLPPGSYVVEVTKRSASGVNQGVVGSTSFVVVPHAANGPFYDYTDLYWNRSEPGWGVSVTQLASGGLFLLWFVYGADNQPTWYFVSNGQWSRPGAFRGTLYRSTGSSFTGPYDPARYQATPVGSAEISFDTLVYGSAALLYSIDGVSYVKFLTRQTF